MSDPEIPQPDPEVPTPEIDPAGTPQEAPAQEPDLPDDGRPVAAPGGFGP